MNIVGWKMRIDGMFVTPAWIALIALAITSGCTKTDSGRADGGDKVSILIDNAARGSSKNISAELNERDKLIIFLITYASY